MAISVTQVLLGIACQALVVGYLTHIQTQRRFLLHTVRNFLLALIFPGLGIWLLWRLKKQSQFKGLGQAPAIELPEQAPAPMLNVYEESRREASVRPFVQVLYEGDLPAKQAAAQAILKYQGAKGVKILKKALEAPHDETRLFASLALLKQEESLANALQHRRLPEEGNHSDESYLAWGQAAYDYALSGYVPEGIKLELLAEGLGAIERCQDLKKPEVLLLFSQLYNCLGRPLDTLKLLNKRQLGLDLILQKAEALYLLKEFKMLSEILDTAMQRFPEEPKLAEYDYWLKKPR
jgi:hypothetical protein